MVMNEDGISVFREINGVYQRVGMARVREDGFTFEYDDEYLNDQNARAISRNLPLANEVFSGRATKEFFDGLLPEGSLRKRLSEAMHFDEGATLALLSRLNNESSGALVFGSDEASLLSERGYEPLCADDLAAFAKSPQRKTMQYDMSSRLSLAGAQSKIGLFHEGDDPGSGWFLPKGSAPSTHIIKAVDGTFPLQSINEALCLRTASYLGFEVARHALIDVGADEPLLVVARFDRMTESERVYPIRLHQADFCQELGYPSWLKYEPTDGSYAANCLWLISRESSNPLSDRRAFVSRLILDWAIGNCDNHLKNHSFVWDEDWSHVRLSPLYDITCTTLYPELSREMGVSLSRSRRIDDVTANDIKRLSTTAGMGESVILGELKKLLAGFQEALEKAEGEIIAEGFSEASRIAAHISEGFDDRTRRLGL